MPVTKQLYELQELDNDIEHTEQTLALQNAQLGNKDTLDTAQNNLNAGQKALDELKHARRDTETRVDDLDSKIKTAEDQLYGGNIKVPKELTNLQHEIKNLKEQRDPLETKELELIDQVEEAEQKVKALTADYAKTEEAWQKSQAQLAADIEMLKKTLENLKQKRREMVAQIEPPAVSLYESVRKLKKQAVSKVEQGICRACRISLSASALQKARSGQPVQCGTCGRILFIS